MSFVYSRAAAMARKEIYHVLRDPFTLGLSLGLPLFMVFIFGFAIEFNVKNIHMAVFDSDKTQSSRRLMDTFSSSSYFILNSLFSPKEAMDAIKGGDDRVALIIPGGFQRNLFAGNVAEVQLLLDGSDNSTVVPILSYITTIQEMSAKKLANYVSSPQVTLKTRFLFNEELNSRWFVIPGLTVTVMAILSVLLTALTVAREWENGSMELLLSTPLEPMEIILGKLVPYALLGILAVLFIYLASKVVFGIPFLGSFWVFGVGCLIFLVTYLSQGLLISILTRKQVIAVQIAIMSGLLPAQLLSGFIFPIESMPSFFRGITMLLPARWFMEITRQSYLKGSTFLELKFSFLALSVLGFITILFATLKFKRNLEP